MSVSISPLAGTLAPASLLIDVSKLLNAYFDWRPDPSVTAQRVMFGTSGHRGSSLVGSFNEWHVLAITQAICDYRRLQDISGPLYLGIDTHALSQPAFENALEVLAANGVTTMIAKSGEFTPTPVISHAILNHNRGRKVGLADGVVITPSHNPPDWGGFKYNLPNGGPADAITTDWIQSRANDLLEGKLKSVQRTTFLKACRAATTHTCDFQHAYVSELGLIIDFDAIRSADIALGVDPLGGAGVHYWEPIAEYYQIALTVVSTAVDPTFRFVPLDWDGKIRMDPSSRYAMQRLIDLQDRFDLSFACDTDHDRHGIVTVSSGLLPPNHYLSVMIDYLFQHRPVWSSSVGIGKTVVSTALIDRLAQRLGRSLYEVPVGFKWFADGLLDGSLGIAGEESAGASFARRDGTVWSTDKDGITASLLAAEMTAHTGRDPGELYRDLVHELGEPIAERVEAPSTVIQKKRLAKLSRDQVLTTTLAGEKVESVLDHAPGNQAAIGGIKVISASGWFAARPSGTEAIYKIYAESFKDEEHLQSILQEAQFIVDACISDTAITPSLKKRVPIILTINGGSSSVKFSLFEEGHPPRWLLAGEIERMGQAGTRLRVHGLDADEEVCRLVSVPDHAAAAELVMNLIGERSEREVLVAVGHRIVHGGPHYYQPRRITAEMLESLHQISPFDPGHLPGEIALAEYVRQRFPVLPQIACFDTAFHHDLPRVARMLPIPRRLESDGIRRYGFHGLSYEYLMEELVKLEDPAAIEGRMIFAHLGSGVSLAAVRDGKSIDTSMSFTPAAGTPMSTRSGDLDPGLAWYLLRTENMSAEQFHAMVNFESGLLGISETSSDMRDLLELEASDVRAAEAIALFCYQIRKVIGSYTAALGGLDTLVFTGGIGENAPVIRARICAGLEFLGIALDTTQNDSNNDIISNDTARVTVRVINTDEALTIARAVHKVLGSDVHSK